MNQVETLENAILERAEQMAKECHSRAEAGRKNILREASERLHLREEKETLLATLPLGYSDGYPYQAVNKAEVLIHGRRWPLVVYMSANHATVDVTGSEGIKIGDEVVLFGTQEGRTISLTEVAERANSTVYKVAAGMSPFLPRIFIL